MWRHLRFECPIRISPVGPVEPNPETAALLLRTFGRVMPGVRRWLLYLAEGSVEPPEEFGSAPAGRLEYAGPLDEVAVASELEAQVRAMPGADDGDRIWVRVRLVADREWQTMGVLQRLLTVEGAPLAARYVSLVADRFDAAGMRVERVAGVHCKVLPFELGERLGWVVDVDPLDGLWWWMVPARGLWPPASGTVTGAAVFEAPPGNMRAYPGLGDGGGG